MSIEKNLINNVQEKIINNELTKEVVPVQVVSEEEKQTQINNKAEKDEENNKQIEKIRQDIEKQFNSEAKSITVDALDFFNGNEKAMKEYFTKIGTEYVVGVPIEESVVRMELQNEILKILKPGTPVVIEAYSRQGKTSMLKSIGNEWEKTNGEAAIFIDPMKTEYKWSTQSKEEFLNDFGKSSVEDYLEDYFPDVDSEDMEGKNPFVFLDELLQKEGKEVMLQIDETTRFSRDDGEKLKDLTENLKNLKNVKVILAWHPFDNLSEISNGAFKDCERIPIKPLTISDVKTLIEKPIKEMGSEIVITNEALEKILDYTGGRPIDINLFCKNLFGAEGKNPLYKMKYDEKDIEEFIKKNSEEDVFGITRKSVFPDVFNSLNDKHRETINKIINNGGVVELNQIQLNEAEDLTNLGLIRKNEDGNSYKINGEITLNLMKEIGV